MSVQTEIDRITQNIENTYNVLEALGCDMPIEKTSDNLASTAGTSKVVLYKEQTLTEEQKTQARTNIGAVSETKVNQLEETVNDLDGLTYGIYVGDTQPTNGVMYWLDTSDDSTGGEDTEVTLSSISATYSGGSVLVGTSVNDLTGIVVTAHYSDGTTATVTGYTLSGTIAEGSNTITVSYGGKSTTITVIGYTEQQEVTLSSISATYSGGNVTVGTALTDLTGITVTGTYSDGSTSAITDYTLSGTIAEGENTITVTYDGLTTTFKVTGVAESGGDEPTIYKLSDIAVETHEGKTAIMGPNASFNTYKIMNIKAGDIVRIGSNNGDGTYAWSDGTNHYKLNDTSMFTGSFHDNYGWKQYTWIADKDYEWLYLSENTSVLSTYPNSYARLETTTDHSNDKVDEPNNYNE